MFSFLHQKFREWARSGTRIGARVRPVRRPECESLEDRLLLSLTGAQLFASSLPAADHAVTASAADGPSVAVWQQPSGRYNFTDIHAQLFNASGQKLGGGILVSNALENTYQPTVAMNASGQFVVAWTLQFSTTDTDVHASLFNSNGTVRAADVGVATTWKNEFAASAGIAGDGSFIISYTLQYGAGDQDVHAAMFNGNGSLLRDIGVAVSSANENNSHVTEAADGEFEVSYLVNGASTAKFYSAGGQQLVSGAGFPTNPTPVPPPPPPASTPTNSLAAAQAFLHSLPAADHPVLASYPGGRSVVVWTTESSPTAFNVEAQVFGVNGQKLGGVLTVAGGAGVRFSPTVAIDATGGFAVAWTVGVSSTNKDIYATLFRADNSIIRGNFTVAATAAAEYSPSIGIDSSGNFDVSYTRQVSGANTDVYAAQFNSGGSFLRTVAVATTSKVEANTGITVAANGTFAVSYTSNGTPLVAHFTATGQPVSGSTSTTPPPPVASLPLNGTLIGSYTTVSAGSGQGTRFNLTATGYLVGLGQTSATGSLTSTGSAASSSATGVLTLREANGTVALSVSAASQGPDAPLPSQFHYSVTSGTGAFSGLRSSGNLIVHLTPSLHTLSLEIVPQAT